MYYIYIFKTILCCTIVFVILLFCSPEPQITILIPRQASKACVVKREFSKAEMLVKQVNNTSKVTFVLTIVLVGHIQKLQKAPYPSQQGYFLL